VGALYPSDEVRLPSWASGKLSQASMSHPDAIYGDQWSGGTTKVGAMSANKPPGVAIKMKLPCNKLPPGRHCFAQNRVAKNSVRGNNFAFAATNQIKAEIEFDAADEQKFLEL